ncbi:kinesin-like protein KIF14 [Oratosquilla oratoria]|uniref:kinesin-like protein KIF14 n=1 Tax=Oratosquilla oratoria TaxID=337810 RepID=UPI003F776266
MSTRPPLRNSSNGNKSRFSGSLNRDSDAENDGSTPVRARTPGVGKPLSASRHNEKSEIHITPVSSRITIEKSANRTPVITRYKSSPGLTPRNTNQKASDSCKKEGQLSKKEGNVYKKDGDSTSKKETDSCKKERRQACQKETDSGKKDDIGRRSSGPFIKPTPTRSNLRPSTPSRSSLRSSCDRFDAGIQGTTKVRTSVETPNSGQHTKVSVVIETPHSTGITGGGGSSALRKRKSSFNRHMNYASPVFSNTPVSSASRGRRSNLHLNSLTPDICVRRSADGDFSPSFSYGDVTLEDETSAVSVGVRVRPLNKREQDTPEISNIIEMEGQEIRVQNEGGTYHTFAYDYVFWSCSPLDSSYADQHLVYTTIAHPLLERAFMGYNVCLFAYGQTGSGKSYCIMGEDTEINEKNEGIIPRFCRDLFARVDYIHQENADEQSSRTHIEVEMSYVEIYNEKIYDLVNGCSGDKREALRVREHPQDGPYVVGAASHLVTSFDNLQTWLLLGNKERSIAATAMNDKSSRSHSVFTLRLKQTQSENIEGEVMEHSRMSIINLVDLAGSERVAAAQSEGDRLKEGVCINKSLLTLGKVITALAENSGRRKTFIPYRESVLTWLLKESLGGNSRTAMIATISPSCLHIEETLSTLRYACQARKIVNWNRINEDPKARIIRNLKAEVERLRATQVQVSPSALFADEADGSLGETEEEDKNDLNVDEKELQKEVIREKEKEIEILREQLKKTEEELTKNKKNWEERLTEAEEERQAALEKARLSGVVLKMEGSGPALVNLCEDPQLSQTLLYRLNNGSTTFGHSHSDVTLRALHHNNVHCTIINEYNKLILHPKENTETYVNGRLVTKPTEVEHNDRIILAGIYYFRVNNPTATGVESRASDKKIDFHYAKEELLKVQEERLRSEFTKECSEAKESMLKELNTLKREMEVEARFSKVSYEQTIDQLYKQLEEEQKHVSKVDEVSKLLAIEKKFLENELQRERDLRMVAEMVEPVEPALSSCLKELEDIFSDTIKEVAEESTSQISLVSRVELSFLIKEANQLCQDLEKPYEFNIHEVLKGTGVEAVVLVRDKVHKVATTCSISRFQQHLKQLQDIAVEGDDDSVFETSMMWERDECLTRVPGFINKLKCSPLNGSFSVESSTRTSTSSRRRSILRESLVLGSTSSNSSANGAPVAIVARSCHQTLLAFLDPSPHIPPLNKALNNTADVHDTVKGLLDYINQPFIFRTDDQLAVRLTTLLTSVQRAFLGLPEELHTVLSTVTLTEEITSLQSKVEKVLKKICNQVARLFQGVEKKVDSLVQESGEDVQHLCAQLVAHLVQLSLYTLQPVPDISNLQPDGEMCKHFIEGMSASVEVLVKKAHKSMEDAASLLNQPLYDTARSVQCSTLMVVAHGAAVKMENFLAKFCKLSVSPDIDESNGKLEAQKVEISRWIGRMENAAENAKLLTKAAVDLVTQLQNLSQGQVDIVVLEKAVDGLQDALTDMIEDAGLGTTSVKKTIDYIQKHYFNPSTDSDSSMCSTSSAASIEMFLENLQGLARRAVHSLRALNKALISYKIYLQQEAKKNENDDSLSTRYSQMKSSLKTSVCVSSVAEEKRVRFNISSNSILGSYDSDESVDM